MSRNFELLQRTEKERELETAEEAERQREVLSLHLSADRESAAEAPVGATQGNGAKLEMDDVSREEIIKLVQCLFLLPGALKVVVFAGVGSGAGCSWLTAQAAQVLAAQVTGSVCVVDTNFRSPGLSNYFAAQNHGGLAAALLEAGPVKSFTQTVSPQNLWLMSCGCVEDSWQLLLRSDLMRARFAELRAEFDYILIDAAPLSQSADAIVLGHLADGLTLVIGANSTHRETALKVIQELKATNVRVLGAVLNKRTFPIPQRIYNRL
jgi:Mrp family chromosome partitioning ATPase